jgi:hypothetical protein
MTSFLTQLDIRVIVKKNCTNYERENPDDSKYSRHAIF